MSADARVTTEECVSELRGHRLCATCHYNLVGQSVLREPHYDLLIVRCPECGTVESVEQYPQLGRWAPRWMLLANLAWFVVIVKLLAAGAMAVAGSSMATSDEVARSHRRWLGDHWASWYARTYAAPPTSGTWSPDKFDEWRAANPSDVLLAEAGGFWSTVLGPEIALVLMPWMIAFVLGVVLCVALLHRRRRALVIAALILLAPTAGIHGFAWWISSHETIDGFGDLAELQVFFPLLGLVLLATWTGLLAGLLVGRKLARRAVIILVPPRLHHLFWLLWSTDGLQVPGMTGRTEGRPARALGGRTV